LTCHFPTGITVEPVAPSLAEFSDYAPCLPALTKGCPPGTNLQCVCPPNTGAADPCCVKDCCGCEGNQDSNGCGAKGPCPEKPVNATVLTLIQDCQCYVSVSCPPDASTCPPPPPPPTDKCRRGQRKSRVGSCLGAGQGGGGPGSGPLSVRQAAQ